MRLGADERHIYKYPPSAKVRIISVSPASSTRSASALTLKRLATTCGRRSGIDFQDVEQFVDDVRRLRFAGRRGDQ
jgi:hypothetical protein